MNKQGYLHELEKALKSAGVSDCADIIEEYGEHFDMKLQDGYGEEEIAARLAPPKEIAEQFSEIKPTGMKSGSKIISAIGLSFADILIFPFFIMLYGFVVVLAAVTISCLVAGVFATVGIQAITGGGVVLLPDMPYICALLLGISLLALAVLAAFGTEYCRLYVTQMLKVYLRWHKNMWGKSTGLPPMSGYPTINPKKRRIMRQFTLIALAVFAVSFIAGFASMMIAAGAPEFWHIWGWFE